MRKLAASNLPELQDTLERIPPGLSAYTWSSRQRAATWSIPMTSKAIGPEFAALLRT